MKQYLETDDSERKAAYLASILLPFAGLIISIRNFRLPYAKNTFFFFCAFFGLIFIFNIDASDGTDSGRYAERLQYMFLSSQSFIEIWKDFYSSESGSLDIYQPLLTFLVSRFTGNVHILFLSFAIVFGYFYSRNLWYVFDRVNNKVSYTLGIYMLGFALVCPIWEINGVRMWTALHVFVFGVLPYLINGNKKSLIWCLLSVFFHFSFIIPVMILGIFLFLPKKNLTIYFLIFFTTSFIKELDLTAVNNFVSSRAPEFLLGKVNAYVNETTAEGIRNNPIVIPWHVVFATNANQIVTYMMAFSLYFWGRKKIVLKPYLLNLFSFSLFIYSFSQILALIPSGGRFITLSQMFIFPTFILFQDRFRHIYKFNIFSHSASVLLLFVIIFRFRMGTDYIGITIFGNPILSFFFETTTPLIQYVKQIF